MHKIKKGDTIVVIAGKDKGKTGKILRMLPSKKHAVVEGINIFKKHVKANPKKNVQGGILEQEASMDLSNVALYNPVSKKADKVGIKILENGTRVRIFKSNNELVDI